MQKENLKRTREPPNTLFHQQNLKNWSLKLPRYGLSAVLIILGVIFVPVGTLLQSLSDDVYVSSAKYDDNGGGYCGISEPNQGHHCLVDFTIQEDISSPLYVYYEVEHFYQNHRRYFGSKSIAQLQGADLSYGAVQLDCTPLLKNGSMLLNPCGLIANSFFTDIIKLDSSTYLMNETGIALPSDVQYLYKQVDGFLYEEAEENSACTLSIPAGQSCKTYTNPVNNVSYFYYYPNDDSVQYLHETYPEQISPIDGVTDEHFIVWMRIASLPTFRKLYGKIEGPFSKGDKLFFNVTANYEVGSFGGSKSLVITTVGEFGGQNAFPGIAFICTGGIAFVLAVLFGFKDYKND